MSVIDMITFNENTESSLFLKEMTQYIELLERELLFKERQVSSGARFTNESQSDNDSENAFISDSKDIIRLKSEIKAKKEYVHQLTKKLLRDRSVIKKAYDLFLENGQDAISEFNSIEKFATPHHMNWMTLYVNEIKSYLETIEDQKKLGKTELSGLMEGVVYYHYLLAHELKNHKKIIQSIKTNKK